MEMTDPTEKNRQILQALKTGSFPFQKEAHYENSRFRYVALRPGVGSERAWINFYDKEEKRSFVFGNVSEGFSVRPQDFTEDYLLSLLQREDIRKLKAVLPAAEYAKLEALDEESNPCLLKLYFK